MMRSSFLRPFLWLALLLVPFALGAVVFQPLPIDALIDRADLVVQGTVRTKMTQRDPAGRIYTRVELQIGEVWKGAVATNPLLILQGGGVLGEEQLVVSGQVEYRIGEEVVAFLVRNERGEALTLGLMQGKFHVWTDPSTGAKMVASPFHGNAETTAMSPRLSSQATPSTGGRAIRLEHLKAQVQERSR